MLFSRNWLSLFYNWIVSHRKIRLFLLGIFISSFLFGCPVNYSPFISGKVTDTTTGVPIPDVVIVYNFSQGKGLANTSVAALTSFDGQYRIPLKAFLSLVGFYGAYRVYIRHPLYEFKSFDDAKYTFMRLPSISRNINIRLARLKDKYKKSATVGFSGNEIYTYSTLEQELEYNPGFYNEDAAKFGLHSKLNSEAVNSEIEELLKQHKMLIQADDYDALIDVLKNSKSSSARQKAAEVIANQSIKAGLKPLTDCIVGDKNSDVRSKCRRSYWDLTGDVPQIFHPEDLLEFNDKLNRTIVTDYYKKQKDKNPDKIYFFRLKQAVEEYTKTVNVTR